MKNSEEAIEKVLAGLRDCDAPVGMERRILDGLQDQASARSRWGGRRLRPIWLVTPVPSVAVRSLWCGVALAGMFAVAIAIPVLRRLGHTPAHAKMNSATVGSLTSATREVAAKSAQLPPPGSVMRAMGDSNARGESNARGRTNARRARFVRDRDSVVPREMRSASYPAPPMPLTEQEKLLLRIAHKGDPVEIAMLNPEMRARRDAEGKAEFENFFEPTTTGDNK